MKLNLRKGRKLETKVRNFVSEQHINSEAIIQVTEDADKVIKQLVIHRDRYQNILNSHIGLLKLAYKIRSMVGITNEKSGINKLLSELAFLTSKKAFIIKHIPYDLAVDKKGVELKLFSKKKQIEEGSRLSENISIKLQSLHETDVTVMKTSIKDCEKRIEDIEDEIAQKNLGNFILLEEEEVDLLKSFDLV